MRISRLSLNSTSARSVSSPTTKEVSPTFHLNRLLILSYPSYVAFDALKYITDSIARASGELDPHGADQVSSIVSQNDAGTDGLAHSWATLSVDFSIRLVYPLATTTRTSRPSIGIHSSEEDTSVSTIPADYTST